ncbi:MULTISPECIES: SRPBCC family protein [unclassified Streptomyces]|uniref:SRPBCC family protein n=1 Tax=unclassified Streptomyces TaxID=2593676 RepID=UPI0036EC1952
MVTFLLERTAPLPLDETWRRLTEWPRHGRVVPLTRVTVVTDGPTRQGTVFVARTGLGPLAFDDRMEVTRWDPPESGAEGRCRLEKRGGVVTGWAEIEVGPGPGGRTRVVWREELGFRFLPRLLDPVVRRTARHVFGRAVNRLLRMG